MRTTGRALVLALVFALAGLSSGCGESRTAETPKGPPRLVADEPKFDFGSVKDGVEVTHVFKLRNTGGAELKIEKAHGS